LPVATSNILEVSVGKNPLVLFLKFAENLNRDVNLLPGATVPPQYPSYLALFAFPEYLDSFFPETCDVFVYMYGYVRFCQVRLQ